MTDVTPVFNPKVWTETSAGRPETGPPMDGSWVIAYTTLGTFKKMRYARVHGRWVTADGFSTTVVDIVRWRHVRRARRAGDDASASASGGTALRWRNSDQIRGYRSQLQAAINAAENGAFAEVDLATARALVQICLQAEHTEKGHGL